MASNAGSWTLYHPWLAFSLLIYQPSNEIIHIRRTSTRPCELWLCCVLQATGCYSVPLLLNSHFPCPNTSTLAADLDFPTLSCAMDGLANTFSPNKGVISMQRSKSTDITQLCRTLEVISFVFKHISIRIRPQSGYCAGIVTIKVLAEPESYHAFCKECQHSLITLLT